MVKHNQNAEILENYMNTVSLSQPQKEVMQEWKNEIFGNMRILCFNQDRVFVYCKDTK